MLHPPVKYAALFFVLVVCCSAACFKEDQTPQPQTTLHGLVKDFRTGQVYAGVKLTITKEYPALSESGHAIHVYDGPVTGTDGSYTYTFNPPGKGDYTLQLAGTTTKMPFVGDHSMAITIGQDNRINFSVYELLNLKVHVTNASS